MGNSFLEFMKSIGIFIICAQSLVHFTAGKSYEKYVKVLIGMMILAQFVAPVRAAFAEENTKELWEEVERFQLEMENAMEEAETISEKMDLDAEAQPKEEQQQAIKIEKIEIVGR